MYVSSGIGSGSGSDGLQQALALALAEWILTGDAEVGLRQWCRYGCYSSGACQTPVELDGAVSGIAPRKLTELDPTVQTARATEGYRDILGSGTRSRDDGE